ncbi:MAG TPA: lytic transglycosylase domain-containing protein [Firmicutes bacterium]|nr:lytic transglycosylase domain-containing protein [Bacillota bacterium]
MNLIAIALMLLPLLEQPADRVPPEIAAASERNSGYIAAALQEAQNYVPAWEQAMRAELADSPVYAGNLAGYIRDASKETGVSPSVIWAVMFTESHGRHWNHYGKVKRGGAGEVGAMQVLPWWERSLKRKYGVELDLHNLRDNVRAGAYILSRGGAELNVMLSYYNTGQRIYNSAYQRKVMRYLGRYEDDHGNLVALRKGKTG